MTNVRANLLYSFVALMIIGFMWSIKPVHTASPTGVYLPLSTVRQKTPANKIKLFRQAPLDAKPIGIVHVQYHMEKNEQQGLNAIAQYAIDKAANAGADGIVIHYIGHSINPEYPALSGFQLMATAITLPPGQA